MSLTNSCLWVSWCFFQIEHKRILIFTPKLPTTTLCAITKYLYLVTSHLYCALSVSQGMNTCEYPVHMLAHTSVNILAVAGWWTDVCLLENFISPNPRSRWVDPLILPVKRSEAFFKMPPGRFSLEVVQLVGDSRVDPEPSGGIMYLLWPVNASGSLRSSVTGKRDVRNSLLSLLPRRNCLDK